VIEQVRISQASDNDRNCRNRRHEQEKPRELARVSRAVAAAVGEASSGPIAQRQCHQRDRQYARPDIQAHAEVGRHDAGGEQFEREDRAPRHEDDGLEQHARGSVSVRYNGGARALGGRNVMPLPVTREFTRLQQPARAQVAAGTCVAQIDVGGDLRTMEDACSAFVL
jgi:hypothetical protein